MRRELLAAFLAVALALPGMAMGAKRIVLIGGEKSEGPARHEYPEAVRILKAILDSSPELQRAGARVDTFGDWPDGARAFEDVATVVWYFDGDERHPLVDAARRSRFETLMKGGVGLVALHQSSTVPTAPRQTAMSSVDGRTLYEQRCAACHDHAQGNVPPREVISRRTKQHVVETLTRGAMRVHVADLALEEIEAIAGYLQ